MDTMKNCQNCGAPMTTDAPGGLCPACLMKVGIGTATATASVNPGAAPAPSGFIPPSPEELARRLPHFDILALVGHGGMGAVYKARQKSLDRIVALKILARERDKDPHFSERFAQEARTLARLNHPNIISVFDFGEVEGLCYLVMEFVDGLSLRQLIQTQKWEPTAALAIVPELCAALQYAHDQGIVHRDIKPENIMLDRAGKVKIADFGLAKLLGREPSVERLTQPKDVMGTPHYMAPEQVEHPQAVDHRADIFSLGVVFYEMLTGELPLGRFAPPSRKVQIDVRLDEVVLHALEKEPERRYQHASQVKSDVETIVSSPSLSEERSGIRQPPAMDEEPPELKAAQHPLRLASNALLALGGAIWFLLLFMNVLGYLVPRGVIRPAVQFIYDFAEHLSPFFQFLCPDSISHLVGTLALVSAWRVRRGQGFGLANAAIILSFCQFFALPLTVPLGGVALAYLWQKKARAAFAACARVNRERGGNQVNAVAGRRLAIASAGLVLISFLCLPAFSLGGLDLGQQPGLASMVFSWLRWLPHWTQGVALVLGVVALLLMRQGSDHGQGLGWAVLGASFAPCVWLTSRLTPGQSHWYGVNPFDLDPSMERVFWVLLPSGLAAGLLALWVASSNARLLRQGANNAARRLLNRTRWIAGLAGVLYAAAWGVNWWSLYGNQESVWEYQLPSALVLFLAGWLAHQRLGRQTNDSRVVSLRWLKWSCWSLGGLVVTYAVAATVTAVFPGSSSFRGAASSQARVFASEHAHSAMSAGNEGQVFVAHGPAWSIELQTISEPSAREVLCWRPDGTVRCRVNAGEPGLTPRFTDTRELIFALSGQGEALNLGELHYELLVTSHGTENVCRNGFPAFEAGNREIKGIVIQVPAKGETARLRLGMPAQNWEDTDAVWAWSGPSSAFRRRSIRREGTDWDLGLSAVETIGGEMTVSFTSQYRREAQSRLVAVDTEGRVHEPQFRGGPMGAGFYPQIVDKTEWNQVSFPGLGLRDLKEFRFQIRPCRWVEFQNVSLQPGRKTKVKIVDAPDKT
jgi:serine/threonine protein kinase